MVRQYIEQGFHLTDKGGRPILIERLENLNLIELYKITTPENLQNFVIQTYEYLQNKVYPACSAASGRRINKMVIDFKNSKLGMLDIKKFLDLTK